MTVSGHVRGSKFINKITDLWVEIYLQKLDGINLHPITRFAQVELNSKGLGNPSLFMNSLAVVL